MKYDTLKAQFKSLDLETTEILKGKYPKVEEVHMLSYCFEQDGETVSGYLRLGWKVGQDYSHTPEYKQIQEWCSGYTSWHNAPFDVSVLRCFGIEVKNYICTQLMGYVLNPNVEPIKFDTGKPQQHSLKAWAYRFGTYKKEAPISWKEFTEQMAVYGVQDAKAQWVVTHNMLDMLNQDPDLWDFYFSLELPFMECIIEMESSGLHVDIDAVYELDTEVRKLYTQVLAELQDIVPEAPGSTETAFTQKKDNDPSYLPWGHREVADKRKNANPNGKRTQYLYKKLEEFRGTPTQIEWALRKHYGWVPLDFTDSGSPKLDKAVLGKLRTEFPIVGKILELRKYEKFLSTYTETLIKLADENGKIYANFNQTVAKTGRLSSSNPNFQNQVSKGYLGKRLRQVFTPSLPGRVLLVADLQAIEYRVLAAVQHKLFMDNYGYLPPDVQHLCDVFYNEEDIHTQMAVLWGMMDKTLADLCLNMHPESDLVHPDEWEEYEEARGRSKTASYGEMFGFGAGKYAEMVGISFEEAEQILANLKEKNPSMQMTKEMVWKEFIEGGGVSNTLFGRRLVYPFMTINIRQRGFQRIWNRWNVSDKESRSLLAEAKRQSFNAKIQGSAADLFKILILECCHSFRKLEKDNNIVSPSSLLAQVHDEVIFEIDEQSADLYLPLMSKILNREDLLPGHIPVRGTPHIGKNWHDAKGK